MHSPTNLECRFSIAIAPHDGRHPRVMSAGGLFVQESKLQDRSLKPRSAQENHTSPIQAVGSTGRNRTWSTSVRNATQRCPRTSHCPSQRNFLLKSVASRREWCPGQVQNLQWPLKPSTLTHPPSAKQRHFNSETARREHTVALCDVHNLVHEVADNRIMTPSAAPCNVSL